MDNGYPNNNNFNNFNQMPANIKSATTAGLLGIFLGAIGVHNFYLGEKQKGITHIALVGGGMILLIVSDAILPFALNWYTLYKIAWLITILNLIAGIASAASGIWGLVEGIILLSQGDAGLARKGYNVAQPMMMPNNNQFQNQNMNQNMNHGDQNNQNMNQNNQNNNDSNNFQGN